MKFVFFIFNISLLFAISIKSQDVIDVTLQGISDGKQDSKQIDRDEAIIDAKLKTNQDLQIKHSDSPYKVNRVLLSTNFGDIIIELYVNAAPISVKNFIDYIELGLYNNTIFHRVIKNFMIQGGGFDINFNEIKTLPSIWNEAKNGLKNKRGTIAYARTQRIHSATSQFYINLVHNKHLDHKDNSVNGYGYAVFGKVIEGIEVVDRIANLKTTKEDVPIQNVIINTVKAYFE